MRALGCTNVALVHTADLAKRWTDKTSLCTKADKKRKVHIDGMINGPEIFERFLKSAIVWPWTNLERLFDLTQVISNIQHV